MDLGAQMTLVLRWPLLLRDNVARDRFAVVWMTGSGWIVDECALSTGEQKIRSMPR